MTGAASVVAQHVGTQHVLTTVQQHFGLQQRTLQHRTRSTQQRVFTRQQRASASAKPNTNIAASAKPNTIAFFIVRSI